MDFKNICIYIKIIQFYYYNKTNAPFQGTLDEKEQFFQNQPIHIQQNVLGLSLGFLKNIKKRYKKF